MINAVKKVFGPEIDIAASSRIGGGCINNSVRLTLNNEREVFVKRNGLQFPGMFEQEAKGLDLLRKDQGPRVPKTLGHCLENGEQYLFLEYIASAPKRSDYETEFGRKLAMLHKSADADYFGLDTDNYIGSSPQSNSREITWPRFFAEKRLGFQLKLAVKNGRAVKALTDGLYSIIKRIDDLLPNPGRSYLLHGDLWGGNAITDEAGSPVLIDPAVYYGHYEAELAMTELFGGRGKAFYSAYNEVLPISPEYKKLKHLYNLYHLLNHLNLFGNSYLGSCLEIVNRFK